MSSADGAGGADGNSVFCNLNFTHDFHPVKHHRNPLISLASQYRMITHDNPI